MVLQWLRRRNGFAMVEAAPRFAMVEAAQWFAMVEADR